MSLLRSAFAARVLFAAALSLPVAAATVLVPSDASASVSIAVGYDSLLKDADVVAVITPVEHQSIWEDGRIYTYTKVKVDQGVAGDLGAGADGYIRTMGGVVGKIGQMVDGEPVFVTGKTSLLFMRKFKAGGVFEVSARAQGQYPVQIDEQTKAKKIIRSMNAGMLLPPKGQQTSSSSNQSVQPQSATNAGVSEAPKPTIKLAQDVLHDRPLDDAAREIAAAWKKFHPAPTPATK